MLSKVRSLYGPVRASLQSSATKNFILNNSRFNLPVIQKSWNVPQYSFSNTENKPEEKENTETTETTETQNQKEEQEAVRVSFVEFMQTEPNPSEINYIYNTKNVYEVDMDKDQINNGKQAYWGMSCFWGAASYLTFNFLNPWFTILPGLLLAGSLYTVRGSYVFAKKLIKKIELIDLYHIKIYPMNMEGKDIICNIQDTEIIGVNQLSSTKGEDGTPQNSYAIIANFTDTVKGKKYYFMRMIIDPKTTRVDNMDLLKVILYGDVQQIGNFRLLVNTLEEGNNETIVNPEQTEQQKV